MILAVILFHFGRQVAAFDGITPDDSGSKGCESGYGMKDNNCVECPEGFYSEKSMCKPCEIGWYSAIKMSTHCIQCNQGETTRSEASYTWSQCLAQCKIPEVKNGEVIDEVFLHGDSATIICNDWYELRDGATVNCTHGSIDYPEGPTCVEAEKNYMCKWEEKHRCQINDEDQCEKKRDYECRCVDRSSKPVEDKNTDECGDYPKTTDDLQFCEMKDCRPETCEWVHDYKPSPCKLDADYQCVQEIMFGCPCSHCDGNKPEMIKQSCDPFQCPTSAARGTASPFLLTVPVGTVLCSLLFKL